MYASIYVYTTMDKDVLSYTHYVIHEYLCISTYTAKHNYYVCVYQLSFLYSLSSGRQHNQDPPNNIVRIGNEEHEKILSCLVVTHIEALLCFTYTNVT